MVRLADSAAARSGLLDVGEVGVGFGEGAEVFGPVVAGDRSGVRQETRPPIYQTAGWRTALFRGGSTQWS